MERIIMKTEKAFLVIGKKLEKEYKKFGFKYSKQNNFIRKRTKKFDYFVFFSHFSEYTHDTCIELHVDLIINDRILLKTNINASSELLHMNLWKMGNHYNIANEELIQSIFIDLRNKIETYLMPQIKTLEGENL
jgi:hypothetical protein